MAGKPKSMSQVKQILHNGKGVKIIARSLRMSKNKVKELAVAEDILAETIQEVFKHPIY